MSGYWRPVWCGSGDYMIENADAIDLLRGDVFTLEEANTICHAANRARELALEWAAEQVDESGRQLKRTLQRTP